MGQPSPAGDITGPPPNKDALAKLFVEKAKETIFINFLGRRIYSDWLYGSLTVAVASATHTDWAANLNLGAYVKDDFDLCLTALVACHQVLLQSSFAPYANEFDQILLDLIKECCQGLNLRWAYGHFAEQ